MNGIASQSASATLGKMMNSVRQTKGKFQSYLSPEIVMFHQK